MRPARTECGDAPVGGVEELAGITNGMPQRFVRLADVFQMSGQAVDEFEGGKFPLDGHHDR